MAFAAEHSREAQKVLRKLYAFVSSDEVHTFLWVYTDAFLRRWRGLTVEEFTFVVHDVFETLIRMCQYLKKPKLEVVARMEQFRSNENVRKLVAFAESMPRGERAGQARLDAVTRAMVAADPVSAPKTPSMARFRSPTKLMSLKAGLPAGSPDVSKGQTSSEDDEEDSPSSEDNLKTSLSGQYTSRARDGLNTTPDCSGEALTLSMSCAFDRTAFNKMTMRERHQLPISEGEMSTLLDIESDKNPDWELAVNNDKIKVEKISPPDSATVLLRAWAPLPGIKPVCACYHICNFTRRAEWDKVFCDYRVVDDGLVAPGGGQTNDVIYTVFKGPFGTSSRDFLQYRVTTIRDGVCQILMRSAEHPQAQERSGFVRAETIVSGYLIRPTADGTGSTIFLVSQSDIKGLIPKWIVNSLSARAPSQWIQQLCSASVEFMKSPHGGRSAEDHLAHWAQPFTKQSRPAAVPSDKTPKGAPKKKGDGEKSGGKRKRKRSDPDIIPIAPIDLDSSNVDLDDIRGSRGRTSNTSDVDDLFLV